MKIRNLLVTHNPSMISFSQLSQIATRTTEKGLSRVKAGRAPKKSQPQVPPTTIKKSSPCGRIHGLDAILQAIVIIY